MASSSRKRKLETEADDYSAGIETEINKFMASSSKKHTIDSDDEEEDEDDINRKKYDIMQEDDIEGQEDSTQEFDGTTRITPFNMKDELEEGYFDGSGMYIWNKKDASEIKDSWLDSIDWMQVKKPDGKVQEPSKDDDASSSEEDSETEGPSPIALYQEVLTYLQPGESILKAIKRLGGGKQLTASERLKQKKLAKLKGCPVEAAPAENNEDKERMTKLTEIVNNIMSSTGNMDIYDETYESLSFKVMKETKPAAVKEVPKVVEDDGLDMFSDDFQSKNGKDVAT